MTKEDIQKLYEQAGGEFYSSPVVLSNKLKKIKALVFDWDGVFHGGTKQGDGSSTFSEVDSMGINMLRFGYYLQNGEIPLTIIITGEQNTTAQKFAQREHFDAIFYRAKDKTVALNYILEKHHLIADEVLFCFDDILDLSVAKQVGVRFLINRQSNPLFAKYCNDNNLADYRSASSGDEHAIREVSEMALGLLDQFEDTVENRIAFSKIYSQFWDARQEKKTHLFEIDKKKVVVKKINQLIE